MSAHDQRLKPQPADRGIDQDLLAFLRDRPRTLDELLELYRCDDNPRRRPVIETVVTDLVEQGRVVKVIPSGRIWPLERRRA